MISIKEIKILEDNSEYFKVSKLNLMENAGKAVANYIKKHYKNPIVIAGHGNNGGDGFVAARYLKCPVYFAGKKSKLKPEAKINFKKIKTTKKINQHDVIIDALFGYGIKGEPKEPYNSLIKKLNKLKTPIVSIDIPSGLQKGNKVYIKPKITLTFIDKKELIKKHKIIDIGIPKKAYTHVGPGELKAVLKPIKKSAHKGYYGKVLIIGGSKDYTGAPLLAAKAISSLKTGTDWVTIAAPEKVAWAINCIDPNIVTKKYKGDYFTDKHTKSILKLAKNFDCILIGPGLGLKSKKFVNQILKINKPKVVDADAIKLTTLKPNAVYTPHNKEFNTLLKNSKLTKSSYKKKLAGTILLKGRTDRIINKNKTKLNTTGTPRMTIAGTGDVLSGLTAGFIAQSNDLFNSACAAAFINGLAGEEAQKHIGRSFTASDLTKYIPKLIKRYS